MNPHRCNETQCTYFARPSPAACGCHKAEAQVLQELVSDLVDALYQYRNDLKYPLRPDSVERRLEMIHGLLVKAGEMA